MKRIYRECGIDCFLLASDGSSDYYVSIGISRSDMVTGVDFGGVASDREFIEADVVNSVAPYLVAEYWTGGFTSCGLRRTFLRIMKLSEKALSISRQPIQASVIYDVRGTNFGFTSGAQDNVLGGGKYYPNVTSYDYDTFCNCIKMQSIHDRAIVYLNGIKTAVHMRRDEDKSPVKLDGNIGKGDLLEMIVENMGKRCAQSRGNAFQF